MSKFYISSCPSDMKKIIDRNSKNYSHSFKKSEKKFNIVAFQKQNSKFANHYDDGEDYAVIVGTYLYRDKTGADAIKEILTSFDPDFIPLYKKEMIGMWSAFFYVDGKGYVFNDYYGLYDTCYSSNNGLYIGTLLGEVSEISRNSDLDEYPFIMEAFQNGAYPKETIFKGIRKLAGSQYLKIECATMELCVVDITSEKLKIGYNYTTEQKAIDDISEMLVNNATKINKVFGAQSCFMTGGLDSRLVFGSYERGGGILNACME